MVIKAKKKPAKMRCRPSVTSIVDEIQKRFRTFGGGKQSSWGNPITAALEDAEPVFAAGVDIRDVVNTVIALWDGEME